jgi:serine/threonine protein kinase
MNIIHRDIKPDNILLSTADVSIATMKLADFGLSRMTSGGDKNMSTSSTMLTGGIGTVSYMAPEMIERKDNWYQNIPRVSNERLELDGMKCDVYSAGIMFAEIAQPRHRLHEVGQEKAWGGGECGCGVWGGGGGQV